MYLPPQFEGDHAQAADLIRQHPFASLISVDASGLPFITHLPLHLEMAGDPDGPQAFTLLGHVARGNPHWRYLRDRPQAVVTFLGPHAYLSPKVYPDLARVPTWNYLAVHCTVQARLVEDAAAKDSLLKKLIGDHEPAYAEQWRGMENAYARKMLSGIVAFELLVMDLQCKLKLNQHRPEAFVTMQAIYENGNDADQDLGRWMKRIAKGSVNRLKG
ncbi:Negative transcriptional regulator [Polaromonas sp. CG9_12]|uniref:FMN-binding negative transcriptional regulator n=1 Tax=Polaromonas sp. CG_9.11 TaxID=2787730 RepID=UPI0004DDDA5D|nr:FMN-binding negative transcriptional regulator [Polaromonas sp. CG_9.11]MBG6077945.1 transcriptional regulator [Polaromonas sp. CG_9.11]CDS55189.1 Negative transcriptional regulator [Polaromonas sp. CG9_12]